jgi:hypothetical protein
MTSVYQLAGGVVRAVIGVPADPDGAVRREAGSTPIPPAALLA